MILISAMTEDRIIGAGDGMPWDVPEEYQQYLDFTRGQTIILGRRSMEIFGPDLTAAHAVVLSRSDSVDRPDGYEGDLTTAAGLDEAVAAAEAYGKTVFCGGGANVYAQCLPLADAMYLSTIKPHAVDRDLPGDAHFPEFDPADWRVAEERDHPDFHFVHYERPGV
ncbi:MAG: dihydrofolate reductase [Planctomycetota bacterium]